MEALFAILFLEFFIGVVLGHMFLVTISECDNTISAIDSWYLQCNKFGKILLSILLILLICFFVGSFVSDIIIWIYRIIIKISTI
jgi:mannose/fructose/N-acetylgalactosamine-specific phosphotransferase system component IIC